MDYPEREVDYSNPRKDIEFYKTCKYQKAEH